MYAESQLAKLAEPPTPHDQPKLPVVLSSAAHVEAVVDECGVNKFGVDSCVLFPSKEDVQAELLSDEVETEEQLHEQLALIDSVIEYSGVSLSDS